MNLTDKKVKKSQRKKKLNTNLNDIKMKKKNPTKKIITSAAEGEGATHLKTLRLKDVKMIGFEIF